MVFGQIKVETILTNQRLNALAKTEEDLNKQYESLQQWRDSNDGPKV